jgi:hypothetical protein
VEPSRKVRVYERPPSADRGVTLRRIAIVLAVLVVALLAYLSLSAGEMT